MFFSKIKDLTRFVSPKKDLIDLSALQKELNDGLFNTMEKTFQACLADKGNSQYTPADIDKIIEKCIDEIWRNFREDYNEILDKGETK